jgi:plastocyanin
VSFSRKPGIWVVAIALLIICIAMAGCSGTTKPPVTTPDQTTVTTPQQTTITTTQQTAVATTQPAPAAGNATVTIKNFAFAPQTVTVTKGSTVTWVNEDAFEHTVVNDASGSNAAGAVFKSNSLAKGASYSFTFTTPGVYPYHCGIHPSMTATITVTGS